MCFCVREGGADEEAPVTGNSHVSSGPVGVAAENHASDGAPAPKEHTEREDHKKEKSVLQAKLTKLAIQIGYAGMSFPPFKKGFLTNIIAWSFGK